jgi:hypothetical protein
MAKLISEWTDRSEQDGMVVITLTITDLENQIPKTTMLKSWEADVVTDQFLNDQAEIEMKNLIRQFKLDEQKFAALAALSEEDKDRILLKWAQSLPEQQRNQILLDGLN